MYKKLSWLLIFVFILTACGGGDDDKGDDKKDDGGGSPAGGAVALVDEWCIARVTGGLGVPPAVFKPLGWLSKAATENSWIKLYSSQAVMDSNDGNLLGEAAPDGIYILIGPQLNLSDHLPEELFTFTVSGELEPYLAVGDYAVGDPVEVAIGGKPALRADAVIEDQDVAVFALMWEVGDEGEYMRMLAAARGDQPNFEAIAYAVAETAFWAEEDVPLPVLPPGLDVPTLDGPVELTLGDPQTVDHSGNPNGALTYSLPAGWIVDESYSDDPTALDYMTLALFSNADAQRRFASRCTYYGDMAALLIRVTDRNTIVGAHEDETPDQARGRSAASLVHILFPISDPTGGGRKDPTEFTLSDGRAVWRYDGFGQAYHIMSMYIPIEESLGLSVWAVVPRDEFENYEAALISLVESLNFTVSE